MVVRLNWMAGRIRNAARDRERYRRRGEHRITGQTTTSPAPSGDAGGLGSDMVGGLRSGDRAMQFGVTFGGTSLANRP